MLREFEIGRYRGLESLKLKDLKRVNVLAGPNNCGKTSILEAIILSGLFNDANDVELLLDTLSSRYYKFSPEFFDSMFAIGCEPVISLRSKFDSDIRELHTQITYDKSQIVRRHIVVGTNRSLFSVKVPIRLCRTGINRMALSVVPHIVIALSEGQFTCF